jgi:hypothetical protein
MHGCGYQVTHAVGGPDPRERPPRGPRTYDIYIPDLPFDTMVPQCSMSPKPIMEPEAAGRFTQEAKAR